MMQLNDEWNKTKLEFIRSQAKNKFDQVRGTWIELGRWALPHRIKWMTSQIPGQRNNYNLVDPTHVIALRSYVAGFLEGNTSASRPWYYIKGQDEDSSEKPENYRWLQTFTNRTLRCFSNSNFYQSAGQFYYDFGVFNTGAHFIEERPDGNLYFHNLIPGSYYLINNSVGEAVIMVREMSFTVKALVDQFGKKRNGMPDWSNFTIGTRKMYEDANYSQLVDVVTIVMENKNFDPNLAVGGSNRKWVTITYEAGRNNAQYNPGDGTFGNSSPDPHQPDTYLQISFSKRKPFVVGKSDTNGNYEYGEKGPTLDALGIIRSLNKKAITKDMALEQMVKPAMQGPASLRKSYITTASNSYVPLDAQSLSQNGIKPVFQMNANGLGELFQDVNDLRTIVGKLYYEDFLLYLTQNPKTRTATETNAIVQEQQLVIGPNLQSLNWTYNVPVVEFVMDFVLDNDPGLPPPPPGLEGQFLRTEFVSVFAQAMKAADLPSMDRYVEKMMGLAQLDPKILDKVNLDRYADLYEDRLYLPSGLNNPQAKVDAMRQQAQAQAQRQQHLQQTLPAVAQAANNLGVQLPQQGAPQGAGDQGQ